jgi:uncharacterized protein (DUF2062 family)
MLFKRRDRPREWDRLRGWLWPRVSWRRSGLYFLKRTARLAGSPHAIAIGAAAGAAVACTPFLGLHFVLALVVAWSLRGSLVASAIGTFVGNPLTFPLMWGASYEIGQLMLEHRVERPQGIAPDVLARPWEQLWPVLEPMALGSLPLGLMVGCAVYVIVYRMVGAYQAARRERLRDGALDGLSVRAATGEVGPVR